MMMASVRSSSQIVCFSRKTLLDPSVPHSRWSVLRAMAPVPWFDNRLQQEANRSLSLHILFLCSHNLLPSYQRTPFAHRPALLGKSIMKTRIHTRSASLEQLPSQLPSLTRYGGNFVAKAHSVPFIHIPSSQILRKFHPQTLRNPCLPLRTYSGPWSYPKRGPPRSHGSPYSLGGDHKNPLQSAKAPFRQSRQQQSRMYRRKASTTITTTTTPAAAAVAIWRDVHSNNIRPDSLDNGRTTDSD